MPKALDCHTIMAISVKIHNVLFEVSIGSSMNGSCVWGINDASVALITFGSLIANENIVFTGFCKSP